MSPDEALAALEVLWDGCSKCRKLRRELVQAVSDRRTVARKAANDTRDRDWTGHLERVTAALDSQMAWTEAHLLEPHEAPKRRTPKVRREPAVDDRPECPRCGVRVNLNHRGRISAHKAPSGNACPCRMLAVVIEAPPVDLPPVPKPPARASRPPRDPDEPSRLDAGSNCEDCGKWLPGERSVCGRCYVHRTRAG